MPTTDYVVTGMTCSHCVSAVTQEVGSLAGVTAVHVELATGDVTITSVSPLSDSDVAAAVDEAGYALAS